MTDTPTAPVPDSEQSGNPPAQDPGNIPADLRLRNAFALLESGNPPAQDPGNIPADLRPSISVAEIARQAGVTYSSMTRYVREGLISATKSGNDRLAPYFVSSDVAGKVYYLAKISRDLGIPLGTVLSMVRNGRAFSRPGIDTIVITVPEKSGE